jgi:hypothetical protein
MKKTKEDGIVERLKYWQCTTFADDHLDIACPKKLQ